MFGHYTIDFSLSDIWISHYNLVSFVVKCQKDMVYAKYLSFSYVYVIDGYGISFAYDILMSFEFYNSMHYE